MQAIRIREFLSNLVSDPVTLGDRVFVEPSEFNEWIKRRNKTANTCQECGCRVAREAGYIVAAPTRNGRTTELTYCGPCAASAADESDELNIFMIIMWVILLIFAVLAVAAKS
jgi:hypothetical protein